jgi:hypothetical protein
MSIKNRVLPILISAIGLFAANNRMATAEDAIALTPGNSLLLFNTSTPQITTTVPVIGLGGSETLRGIDVRPLTGELYGSTVATGSSNNSVVRAYKINPSTGLATFVGATAAALAGAGDVDSGYDFNPTVDRIRYVNINDENARMNPNTGVLSGNDTDLTTAATMIAVAYDRNVVGTTLTTLYAINRATSEIATIGGSNSVPSPNGGVVTDHRALGITLNAAHDGGLDVSASGTAFAALSNIGTGVTGLYTIDFSVAGGAATFIGAIGNGSTEVYSLAVLISDTDGDGVNDVLDNCDTGGDSAQSDIDGDGTGDACDADQDGDGLPNTAELAMGSDSVTSDSDGDGLLDGVDACPSTPAATANGCPPVPSTQITSGPKTGKNGQTKVKFSSTVAGSKFECALDSGGFQPCKSPKVYKSLNKGKHKFRVRALTSLSTLDLSPASKNWKVK